MNDAPNNDKATPEKPGVDDSESRADAPDRTDDALEPVDDVEVNDG